MKRYQMNFALVVFTMVLSAASYTSISAQGSLAENKQPLTKISSTSGLGNESCSNCGESIASWSLGAASSYAVMGASTVTNTGPSTIIGDLGVNPGTAITGFPPGVVVGAMHTGDTSSAIAQADAIAGNDEMAVVPCDTDLTGQDLGGMVLTPGMYCFDTTAQLSGMLTLDAQGDPNAVFVIRTGSTLTTASGSSVIVINGALACNVYFQVGSSATLGTATQFRGTIMAEASITLNTGASLFGRAIAMGGAVTMDTNDVTICNLAPSAAYASVSGRITNNSGRGISGVSITLIDPVGGSHSMTTSSLGYYSFDGIAAGHTVVLSVTSKRYVFEPSTRTLSVFDELSEINFVAQ